MLGVKDDFGQQNIIDKKKKKNNMTKKITKFVPKVALYDQNGLARGEIDLCLELSKCA